MTQALAIVSGHWDSSQLKEVKLSNTDVLAFDLPAMQACRLCGIPFLTPSDFYSSDEFRWTFRQMLSEIQPLFENLDRKYTSEITYPHAFKGNMYPFFCYFADLHYLRALGRAINQRYADKCIMMTGFEDMEADRTLVPMSCDIFESQLFTKSEARIYNLRHLSKLLGQPPIMRVPPPKQDWLKRRTLVNLHRRYGYLLRPTNWSVLFEKLKTRFGSKANARNGQKIIWCIQDGFDVAALKKYMPDFAFVNPIRGLLEKGKDFAVNDIGPIYKEAVLALEELYPEWASEIAVLMEKYHEGVVCRLAPVAERITEQLHIDQPRCALYSIGAVIPLETLYAWVLNQYKVPIFSFQHGGSNLYFNTPQNKYVEFNDDIDQTVLCVSKIEAELRQKKDQRSGPATSGAIRLFEWHQSRRRRRQAAGNGRVLYVQGRYPSEAWKGLFGSEGEDVLFAKHEQFFDLAAKYDFPLDIKLFPGTAKCYAPYFRRFIQRYGLNNARLLYDVPAEVVAPNYSLIIVEYIGSALNAFFMALDRPIVYYLAERDLVNPVIAHDFYRRHYVAHDGKELDEVLGSYKRGRLASKYSSDYVDKYVYPLQSGNPGIRIAQMLGQGAD